MPPEVLGKGKPNKPYEFGTKAKASTYGTAFAASISAPQHP
jgi:hypothetical protein